MRAVIQSTRFVLGVTIVVLVLAQTTGLDMARHAQAEPPINRHAILFGANKFMNRHAQDYKSIASTLRSRNGYQVTPLGTDDPMALSDAIERHINAIKIDARHTLAYCRGELHFDSADQAYLAVDFLNPLGPIAGGMALQTIVKHLAKCGQAGGVALFLDIEGVVDPQRVERSVQLALAASGQHDHAVAVVVCCPNRDLPVGPSQRSSHFSYWFRRALQGDSDHDQNGMATLQELTDYLNRQLEGQATIVVPSPAMLSSAFAWVRPRTLDELIADLADRLSTEFHGHSIKRVAVPHFRVAELGAGQERADFGAPGQKYGPLIRYCVRKLTCELATRAGFQYQVLSDHWLLGRLQHHRLGPHNIQAPEMRKVGLDLSREVPGQPITVVLGELSYEAGSVEVTCTPWNPLTGAQLPMASGRAMVNSSEWAMLGRSAKNPSALRARALEAPSPQAVSTQVVRCSVKPASQLDFNDKSDREAVKEEVQILDDQAARDHPLCDDRFPYRIGLKVNGEALEGRWSRNKRDRYVTLDQDDRYSIVIENNSTDDVFVRLLVDGLNTLPDRPLTLTSDIFEVVYKDESAPLQPAQHVNLTSARAWHCEPGRYGVRGFFTVVDQNRSGHAANAERAEFVVTDASDSEAYRKGYTKDIGIITAAFYDPMEKKLLSMAPSPRFGTRMGDTDKETVTVYDGSYVPGELLCVIHLRYGFASHDEGLEQPLADFPRFTKETKR